MGDIGVGLVSVGWMGRLHSRAYLTLPLIYPEMQVRPRLVLAADTAQLGRRYARESLGYDAVTEDWRVVVADPRVDVVSICAPNFLHSDIAIAAARAGKAIWLEKPAGRDLSDTAAIAKAVADAGVVSCVGFNYRHAPAVQLARTLVAQGRIGQITNIRGRFFGGFSANPDDPLAWRFVRELSGSGVMNDLLGHLVDLMHWVLGPIGSVSAAMGTFIEERPAPPDFGQEGLLPVENEDYAVLLVRFGPTAIASGAIGSLEASRIAVGCDSDYGFELHGTEGAIRWNFARMNELQLLERASEQLAGFRTILAGPTFPDYSHFQPSLGTPMGYDDLKTIEASKFLSAVIGGPAIAANINDAVASAAVLRAAELSSSTGQWQKVAAYPGTSAATSDR